MKFLDALQIVLIVLKILGIIKASWFMVLIPFWIVLAFVLLYVIMSLHDGDWGGIK